MKEMSKAKRLARLIGFIVICIFAIIGFLLVSVYIATELGWTDTKGIIDTQHDYFQDQQATSTPDLTWTSDEEWAVLAEAIPKDTATIQKAAEASGVPARLIVSSLVVEQLRLFYSDREVFKEIFSPLKILGDQSQFSWGVMGVKQDTAIEIENNLKDPSSPWYLGPSYAHLLDYPATSTPDEQGALRFARLTDQNNRYYSYLYAGVAMKQVMTQWQNAGIPLNDLNGNDANVGVISTLFNIGFRNSNPHADPQIGGAEIDIASTTYSFGGLAQDFYDSNELIAEFPR